MKSPALACVLEDAAVTVPPCGHISTLETVRRLAMVPRLADDGRGPMPRRSPAGYHIREAACAAAGPRLTAAARTRDRRGATGKCRRRSSHSIRHGGNFLRSPPRRETPAP